MYKVFCFSAYHSCLFDILILSKREYNKIFSLCFFGFYDYYTPLQSYCLHNKIFSLCFFGFYDYYTPLQSYCLHSLNLCFFIKLLFRERLSEMNIICFVSVQKMEVH